PKADIRSDSGCTLSGSADKLLGDAARKVRDRRRLEGVLWIGGPNPKQPTDPDYWNLTAACCRVAAVSAQAKKPLSCLGHGNGQFVIDSHIGPLPHWIYRAITP